MEKQFDAAELLASSATASSSEHISQTLANEGYWLASYASKATVNTLGGALGELRNVRTPNYLPDMSYAKDIMMESAIAFGLVTGGEGMIDSMLFPNQQESFGTQLYDTVGVPLILGFMPGSNIARAGVAVGLHLVAKLIEAANQPSDH